MELICNQPKYLPSVDIIVMVVAGTGVVFCVVEAHPFNCNDSFTSLDCFIGVLVFAFICCSLSKFLRLNSFAYPIIPLNAEGANWSISLWDLFFIHQCS